MQDATTLILSAGHKPTTARVAVLDLLSEAETALSHKEVLDRLGASASLDRVTVYRVLDWLVETGLAHKLPGVGRAWKFQARHHHHAHDHAHFECRLCHKTMCLPDVHPTIAVSLPENYALDSIDLHVVGLCSDCK